MDDSHGLGLRSLNNPCLTQDSQMQLHVGMALSQVLSELLAQAIRPIEEQGSSGQEWECEQLSCCACVQDTSSWGRLAAAPAQPAPPSLVEPGTAPPWQVVTPAWLCLMDEQGAVGVKVILSCPGSSQVPCDFAAPGAPPEHPVASGHCPWSPGLDWAGTAAPQGQTVMGGGRRASWEVRGGSGWL